MFNKIAILTALTLVLAVGALAVVTMTTHAQEMAVEESPAVEAMLQEEAVFEYQYAYQYGEGDGDPDPIMTQSRTQTQTRVLQDGECDGDGEQLQIRKQLHVNNNQSTMRQQRLNQNLNLGDCNGECAPLRQGNQGN